MGNVFFLLWMADVVSGISIVGVACALLISIWGGACWIASAFMDYSGDNDEAKMLRASSAKACFWLMLPVMIAVFTPSSSTLKLAAAGKAAEVLAQTPTATKAVDAINAVLDKITEKAKEN